MLKAAIFDLDGTITDSMEFIDNLSINYLKNKGCNPEPGLNEKLFSMSFMQGAEYFSKKYLKDLTPEEILEQLDLSLKKYYKFDVVLKPGARELINTLYKMKIPMCIVSSTGKNLIEEALNKHGLLEKFKGIFSVDETGISKTDTGIYKLALKDLEHKPQDTFVFEDAPYALRTAAKLGLNCVGIPDNLKEDNSELKKISDIYIESLEDFNPYLYMED